MSKNLSLFSSLCSNSFSCRAVLVPVLVAGLPLAARADLALPQTVTPPPPTGRATPLWKNVDPAPPQAQAPDQHTMMLTLVGATPMLVRLRDWRDTARGQGAVPQRTYKLAAVGGNPLQLQIGTGGIPASDLAGWNSGAASVDVKLGRVAVGSTAPMSALNYALRGYDATMAGAPTVPDTIDQSQMTWLTGQPLAGRSGQLNLVLAQGQRDLTPGQKFNKQFAGGTVWGANGNVALTSAWKLRGEWLDSQLNTQEQSAAAWKVGVDGPLRHPWGVAKVSAAYHSAEAGFAPFASAAATPGAAPTADTQAGQVGVQQDVALGKLQGTTAVAVSQNGQQAVPGALAVLGPPTPDATPLVVGTRSDTINGVADLKLKLSPSAALLGKHEATSTSDHTFIGPPAPLSNAVTAGLDKLTQRQASDVGVELKLTHSIALAVTTGQAHTQSQLWPSATAPTPLSLLDEDHTTLRLQRQTTGGSVGIALTQRIGADSVNNASNTRGQDTQLQAERQLFSWLRLKGSLGFTNENDLAQRLVTDRIQRSAEAQLSLPMLGRFNMSYSDAASSQGAEQATTPGAGSRAYGISYNLGDSAGKGGLGLAVEYSRRQDNAAAALSKWRVGVTYR